MLAHALQSGVYNPSGMAMPSQNLPGWQLIFADDFTTHAPLGSFEATYTRWGGYNGFGDTSGNGQYSSADTISVQNSMMDFYVHTLGGTHFVCAPGPILPGKSNPYEGQLYGRYAIRYRSEAIPGYKIAWLLWPDTNSWNDGEIDFPETDLTSGATISAFSHYKGNPTQQDAFGTSATFTSWHTSVIEWTPGQVTFILDDVVVGTCTANVPNTAMHWVLQTETNLGGNPILNTTAGHIQIDWVVIWSAM